MTEQTYEECEIPIYSVKDSRKFKDNQARLLFNLCETSITCRIVENVWNIVVFDSSWLVFTNYCIKGCLHMILGYCSVNFIA